MSGPVDRPSPPTTLRIGSPRAAECWADLTRSLTLYPETNSRVLRSLASFLEELRASIDPQTKRVELGFSGRVVWVDETPHDVRPESNLAWLKERLDRADLSGALFAENVDEASLLAFTKRLLELYTRRDMGLGFEALWPQAYAGMALLERRFEGAFSDRDDEEAGKARPNVAGRARRKAKMLRNALTLDERIRARIEGIQGRLRAGFEPGSELGLAQ